MGLSICKRIVEAHGGRIWFAPATGGGSVFHFTIPDSPREDGSGPMMAALPVGGIAGLPSILESVRSIADATPL
jgi:hypothetical protein